MSAAYHILSLDGGGIRGVLTLRLLQRMETQTPFLHKIDLFAGTSTGGIIALGLAAGLTPTQLLTMYEEIGPTVFRSSIWNSILELRGIIGAPFESDELRDAIYQLLGDMRIGELERHVLIPTFDLDCDKRRIRRSRPKFFHTFGEEDQDERVIDVALRTSAAPSFFPVYQGYIDGGVVANNPAMCAVAEAVNPQRGNQALDAIRMLSVGTGHQSAFIEAEDDDWGGWQWTRHITTIFIDGRSDVIDYQCRQMLQKRYWRLNPILPRPIGAEGVRHLGILTNLGKEYVIDDALSWVQDCFNPD